MANPKVNDPWRILAAQLGLEVEPEETEAPPAEVPDEPKAFAPEVEPVVPPTDQFVTVTDTFVEQESIDTGWLTPEPVPAAAPIAEYDDGSPPPEPAEDDERRPRRRRTRRRKGEAPVAEVAEASDDEGDSTAELVKDWDIPSWNDLIASLYRPDR